MNGARSTYMRRGFLLTALAAAALLAVSPGTASAQISVTAPATVAEGNSVTVTVSGRAYVPATTAATTSVTVTVGTGTGTNEDEDVSLNQGAVATLVFPANTGDAAVQATRSATVTVQTTHDPDAEDENVVWDFTLGTVGTLTQDSAGNTPLALATTGNATALKIDDDETQTYVLELGPGQTLTEGDVANVTLKAVPEHEDNSIALTLHSSDPVNYLWDDDDFSDGTVDAPATIQIGSADATPAGVNSTTVYVKAPDNDKNRETDTVTLTAHSGSAGSSMRQGSLDISFADDHTLAPAESITAVAMDKEKDGMEVDSVMEGGDPVYLTISVDRGKAADKDATTIEKLTVDVKVAPAHAADASVTPTRVELPAVTAANGVQKAEMMVELSALADEDVGDETLTLHLEVTGESGNGSGTSTGMFEIDITDDTAKKIWPLDEDDAYPAIMAAIEEGGGDEGLNPGESFTVMTDDLFGLMDGYVASYGASVEGDEVSVSTSGDSVTVTADMAGEAKVTVTGTARMASSSFQAEQTVSNSASITFPVMVTDKKLVVMLHAPDSVMDGNIVEGSSYDIQVMANRAVMEDTMVMFMRDRAASDADEDDYSIENVTIMAGEDMAMATLMVTEDMMDDSGHAMGEALVLYAEVDGEETNSLMFTIWDEAVPALPLIGQLVLALFLALGGARLYRRRQG